MGQLYAKVHYAEISQPITLLMMLKSSKFSVKDRSVSCNVKRRMKRV